MENTQKYMSTKKKILASALELFFKSGYGATSMRAIAKKAGLTVGGLYNHYQGKVDILLEIQTDYIDDLIKTVEEYLETNSSVGKRIESVCINLLKVVQHHKESGSFSLQMGKPTLV